MLDIPPGQMRALVAILLLLAAGTFVFFLRRGRDAEVGFVITGQPRSTLTPNHVPSASSGQALSAAEGAIPSAPSAPVAESAPNTSSTAQPTETAASVHKVPAVPPKLVVHVAGAVQKPGVYRLPPDARGEDALKAAGGAKADANLDAINLAARVEDGTQLYVPTRKEQPSGGAATSATVSTYPARPTPTGAHPTHASASSHSSKLTTPGQGTVNINAASAEELQRLPGVGPATASRILEFRKENGPFTSTDQLMDISGIGEKKFEKMKAFVRVR